MMIEPLEPRRLLAGNVGVTLASGVLQLTGDDAANQVLVETSADGSRLTLTGEDGTAVAGRTRVAYDFAGAIVIRLAGGDDVLRVRGARFSNGVGIELGAGDDVLDVKQSRFAAVDVFGNAGDDTAAFSGVTATGRLRVFPGLGADTTGLRDVRARVGLDVSDAGTRADIGFIRVSASGLGGKSSYVGTSGSSDRLQILDSDFEAFSARLNAGDDTAYVRGTTFKTASPIDGGSGTNDINREVILSWDFADGVQGWQPQVAGEGGGTESTPVTPENFAAATGGGTYGLVQSPTTAVSGTVYQLDNDGTAYLFHELGPQMGLEASRRYTQKIESKVAVNGGPTTGFIRFTTVAEFPRILGILPGNGAAAAVLIENTTYSFIGGGSTNPYEDTIKLGIDESLVSRGTRPGPLMRVKADLQGRLWLLYEHRNADMFGKNPVSIKTISIRLTPVGD